MIKALILDVDGVLVGAKPGFNFPDPNEQVIQALKQIRASGILISLCTAKPYFAIEKIIQDSQLDNIHITEAGAVIINPLNQNIFRRHIIDSGLAVQIIQALLARDIYTEVYDGANYQVQQSQKNPDVVQKHFEILQRKPIFVPLLSQASQGMKISKIMPIALEESERAAVEEIFLGFRDNLSLQWAIHPSALPWQFGVITVKGVNKRQGALDIAEGLGVGLENILGVGDGRIDWEFIELCGYGVAMGNASAELKELVLTKGPERSYIGPDVDDNGILDIFQHFQII